MEDIYDENTCDKYGQRVIRAIKYLKTNKLTKIKKIHKSLVHVIKSFSDYFCENASIINNEIDFDELVANGVDIASLLVKIRKGEINLGDNFENNDLTNFLTNINNASICS